MKKTGIVLSSVLAVSISFTVLAATPESSSPGTGAAIPNGLNNPCEAIVNTCLAYIRSTGSTNDEGLVSKCVKPLLDGKTVYGVNVSAAEIKSCNEARAVENLQQPQNPVQQ